LVLVGVGPVSFYGVGWRCFLRRSSQYRSKRSTASNASGTAVSTSFPRPTKLHEDFQSGFFSRVGVFLGHRNIQDTNLNGASHETKSGNDKLRQYSELPEPDSAPGSGGGQSKLKISWRKGALAAEDSVEI
jgi:hypothetical protein